MILCDVNVLVYAHREETPDHAAYADWLTGVATGPQAFAISDLVLSGFVRVVTHPRVFDPPSPLGAALAFAEQLRARPNALAVAPGDRHWSIFLDLCRRTGAKGNHVPDAYLAALAIESGSEWITTDRGFARYPEVRWRHPLEP